MSTPTDFVIDVDGVMTTGQFLYSADGKLYKIFGAHDSDGLKLIRNLINITFITADSRGFGISKKRIVDDMGYELKLVSEEDRLEFMKKNFKLKNTIFMGDGIFDSLIIKESFFGIAPSNARIEAIEVANYVTKSSGGNGAVLDACLEINKRFFTK